MSGVRGATRWPAWRVDLLRMLAGNGLSAKAIAREMDLTELAVKVKAQRLGISFTSRTPSIWRDPANVARLAALVAEGWSPAEIARDMGVARNTVIGRARRDGLTFAARRARRAAEAAGRHGGFRAARTWSDADLALVREIAEAGGTAAQAARRLCVETGALTHAARKAGIRFLSQTAKTARMWEGRDARLRELARAGFAASRIALDLGVTVDAVRARCRALRLPMPRDGRAGPAPVTLSLVPAAEPMHVVEPAPMPVVEREPMHVVEREPMHVPEAAGGRCRAPLWPDEGYTPLADKFYCGAPQAAGSIWCAQCRTRLTTRARVQSVEALAFGRRARKRRAG